MQDMGPKNILKKFIKKEFDNFKSKENRSLLSKINLKINEIFINTTCL